jgi:hypothetical protein
MMHLISYEKDKKPEQILFAHTSESRTFCKNEERLGKSFVIITIVTYAFFVFSQWNSLVLYKNGYLIISYLIFVMFVFTVVFLYLRYQIKTKYNFVFK